jgi:hypothetical protein
MWDRSYLRRDGLPASRDAFVNKNCSMRGRENLRAEVLRRARLASRKEISARFRALFEHGETKDEWIGRTETMQFHFVIGIPAPWLREEFMRRLSFDE